VCNRATKHKTYINFPLIPTKNIKVDEVTKCLAGAGEISRYASKTSRSNSKALNITRDRSMWRSCSATILRVVRCASVSSHLYRVFLRLYPCRYKAFLKLSSERSRFISERCCSALFLRSSRFRVTFSIICNSTATVSLIGGLPRGAFITLVISASGIPRVLPFLVRSDRFLARCRILRMVLGRRLYEGHCKASSADVRDEFTIACRTPSGISFLLVFGGFGCRPFVFRGFLGILISCC
jgi:hypothetical protein